MLTPVNETSATVPGPSTVAPGPARRCAGEQAHLLGPDRRRGPRPLRRAARSRGHQRPGAARRRCRAMPSLLSRSSTTVPGTRLDWPRKFATNAVPRQLVELRGRAQLLDPARVHHRDRVGHGHGLLLVVGDVHEGEADLVWMRLSSSCIWRRSLRSSAPSGSSSSSTAGWLTRARASATRCCWPPESWAGLRWASAPSSHQLAARPCARRRRRARAAARSPNATFSQHGQVREQGVALEDGVHRALVRPRCRSRPGRR